MGDLIVAYSLNQDLEHALLRLFAVSECVGFRNRKECSPAKDCSARNPEAPPPRLFALVAIPSTSCPDPSLPTVSARARPPPIEVCALCLSH